MPNRLTKGKLLAGTFRGRINSLANFAKFNTVARTDTVAKNLFVLPVDATPIDLVIFGSVASNAGTTATVSVGKTGNNTFFLNGFDVKGSGAQHNHPTTVTNLFAILTADTQVVGIYAETGAASTTGGPWTVMMEYTL